MGKKRDAKLKRLGAWLGVREAHEDAGTLAKQGTLGFAETTAETWRKHASGYRERIEMLKQEIEKDRELSESEEELIDELASKAKKKWLKNHKIETA